MNEPIEWRDPPKSKVPGRGELHAIAKGLRSRPGQWALIKRDVFLSAAVGYRRGSSPAFPVGEFEFTTHGNGRAGRGDIYARYVGDEATS